MELLMQTEQLKKQLVLLKDRYENNAPPESKKDKQFFLMMKESTSPIYDLLATWEDAALLMVKERKIDVHPQQITSTKENMELLLLHSYYIDVKRKRYMELNHSIHYIFDQIVREMR